VIRRAAFAAICVLPLALAACASDDESSSSTTPTVPPDAADVAWPEFGFDAANSRSNPHEVVIGVDNVGDLAEKWEVDGLEGVTATPAVVDGIVYVGDYTGSVRAFDAETGDEVWATQLETGAVYGTPAITDDRVFAGDQSGFLHALDRETGEVLWTERAGEHASTIIFNSPVTTGDLVIAGVGSVENFTAPEDYTFQGSVSAYDQATGEERWRAFSTPNDETGGAGVAIWSTPAVDEERGLVYVGTGQAYEAPAGEMSDSIIAIDVETGEVAWHHQFTEGDVRSFSGTEGTGPDADVGAGPNLFTVDDHDLVGAGDKAGRYKALDRDTGEEVWSTDLTTGGVLGGVEATAAVADGTIFVGSNQADEASGTPTGTATLFALDAATGEVEWEHELEGSIFGSPTVANGVVYQGTQLRTMHAFDAESGDELWTFEPPGDVGGGPSVVAGVVYWGYGFFIFEQPDEPLGGLFAFALDD
jgi:polyvinyl alcohol dehydrogenase (cytochrome)